MLLVSPKRQVNQSSKPSYKPSWYLPMLVLGTLATLVALSCKTPVRAEDTATTTNNAINNSVMEPAVQPVTIQPATTVVPQVETPAPDTTTNLAEAFVSNDNASAQIDNSTALPQPALAPVSQVIRFPDVQGHWAQGFIEALAARDIIQGFYEDRTFRPDAPVTRAQFAAMLQRAFLKPRIRNPVQFADVPANHWATSAIESAYSMGFLSGYPNNIFNPNQNIPRVQVLVSLASGLDLKSAETATNLETYFQDAAQIPGYARNSIAAATANRVVVNYPNVAFLNPNQVATRADVAAFIYQALASAGAVPPLAADAIASAYIAGPQQTATTPPPQPEPVVQVPSPGELQQLQTRLQALQETRNFGQVFQGSPSITIANPAGFGADNNVAFVTGTYQERTRGSDEDDGALGLGIGLGDSRTTAGVELAYTIASFGSNRDFGSGGFNVKVHRQLPNDFAVAVGWNGFLNIGDRNDFQDSVYGVVSKVFRTRDDVNLPLSRVAVTAGLGTGQFRSVDDINNDVDAVNVFGSVAFRIAQPVSAIAEWTGQDLALGVSIVPIKDVSWVITPALRDVTGAGDGVRFTLGTGFSFRFK